MAIWTDTFIGRNITGNSNNWGTASDNESWSTLSGGGGTSIFAVSGGEGTFVNTSSGSTVICKIGTNTAIDIDVLCCISPGSSNDTIDVFARLSDFSHYYRLDFTGTNLQLGYKNGGSFVTISSVSAGITLTNGVFYYLRFRVLGTSLYGKVWQSGNSEPSMWTITANDGNVLSGGVGCGCNSHSTTVNVQFNNFYAQSISNYSLAIIADNPVAYYRMDETSGNIAHDYSGNHYDAALSGNFTLSQQGAPISGTNDKSILLTGANSTVNLPSNLNYTTFTTFSFEFWIKIINWQYVAVTCDGSNTLVYLNGVIYSVGASAPVEIGSLLDFAGSYSNAYISDIALYRNTILSITQIGEHYVAAGYVPPTYIRVTTQCRDNIVSTSSRS